MPDEYEATFLLGVINTIRGSGRIIFVSDENIKIADSLCDKHLLRKLPKANWNVEHVYKNELPLDELETFVRMML